MQAFEIPSAIDSLGWGAQLDFDDAADFIWKTPTLIEHQTEIEKAKLYQYFPDDVRMRLLRWRLESRKLEKIFPSLMSTGNVFIVVSLFEMYALRLCLLTQTFSEASLRGTKGQGISRTFEYLRGTGIDHGSCRLWTQVDAALKIRNCLMHASGFLAQSRDEKDLRRILKSGTFLPREHRNSKDMVQIAETDLGQRLQITNEYPWLLCCYLRDFFLEMCQLARQVCQTRAEAVKPTLGLQENRDEGANPHSGRER